jgi:hypothetical protein
MYRHPPEHAQPLQPHHSPIAIAHPAGHHPACQTLPGNDASPSPLFILYVHVAGSLRDSEPGPVGIFSLGAHPLSQVVHRQACRHLIIYHLCLSSFTSLAFPSSGRKLLCEMHQTMTKLAFLMGLVYLDLLFISDGVFLTVPAI